jgi:hypothetical protein
MNRIVIKNGTIVVGTGVRLHVSHASPKFPSTG